VRVTDDAGFLRFDVLVTADGTASESGRAPSHPSRDRIGQCNRWLAEQGAECHPTGFGLACTMPRSAAESLFGTAIRAGEELTVPTPIAHLVDQITVPVEPELF
jgi:hypothetical protein